MKVESGERGARIANIDRTMELLELLCGVAQGLTVTELAQKMSLPKGVVSRITTSLLESGYLHRDPHSNRYRITFKLVSLGLRHLDQLGVENLYRPLIQAFADESGELIHIALVDGDVIRYIARAEGQSRVRVLSLLGTEAVLHGSGAGKVWLASLGAEEGARRAQKVGLEQRTKRTITSLKALQRELEAVRAQGYAINVEEVDEGVSSVAAPIHYMARPENAVIGAVTLTGPSYRLPEKRLRDFGEKLKKIAIPLGTILSVGDERAAAGGSAQPASAG